MNDDTMKHLHDELARQDAAWAEAMQSLESLAAAGVAIPAEVADALDALDAAGEAGAEGTRNHTSASLAPSTWIRA
jgi:hypothetical protein